MKSSMTPQEIVSELDRHIVGQQDAKRAVAIALRNRWRRQQVDEKLRGEITPKNILMIGPTGVGKTEIARRLARLADAPFIKVEATKFTEVGYVGKDVDSIVRDLVEMAVKQTRVARDAQGARARRGRRRRARPRRAGAAGAQRLRHRAGERRQHRAPVVPQEAARGRARRQGDRDRGRRGRSRSWRSWARPAWRRWPSSCAACSASSGGSKRKTRKLKIGEAMKLLVDEEAAKLVNEDEIRAAGDPQRRAERHRLHRRDRQGRLAHARARRRRRVAPGRAARPAAAGRGHDRVDTKYGMVRPTTSCSSPAGAFHLAKPSDLIPELQGRFPIRVELDSLSVAGLRGASSRRRTPRWSSSTRRCWRPKA